MKGVDGSTSASSCTAVGEEALKGITSGYSNTAIGKLAGATLTTGIENIIIGAETNTLASGDNNSIVIGKSATGLGSNTTVIGNSSTTQTKLFGKLVTTTYTVATLPTGSAGSRSFVTDALAPSFGVAVAGGGAIGVPVYHDGTSWKVG